MAAHICEVFCKVDAPSASFYKANLEQFTQRLDKKLDEWQKQLAPFHGQEHRGLSQHVALLRTTFRTGL